MKDKYNLKKDNLTTSLIPFYFISLLMITLFFSYNIEVQDTVKLTGIIKDYSLKRNYYSEYEGIVEDIYIKSQEKVEIGDSLYKIRFNDKEKYKRTQRIEQLEKLSLKDKKYLEELNELKTISDTTTIKAKSEGYIKDIYVLENDFVKINDKVFELKKENEEKQLYIETYISPLDRKQIKIGNNVNIHIKDLKKEKNIIGNIIKIEEDIHIKENNPYYKATINIIEKNENIIEGLEVKLSIIIKRKKLINWLVDMI